MSETTYTKINKYLQSSKTAKELVQYAKIIGIHISDTPKKTGIQADYIIKKTPIVHASGYINIGTIPNNLSIIKTANQLVKALAFINLSHIYAEKFNKSHTNARFAGTGTRTKWQGLKYVRTDKQVSLYGEAMAARFRNELNENGYTDLQKTPENHIQKMLNEATKDNGMLTQTFLIAQTKVKEAQFFIQSAFKPR